MKKIILSSLCLAALSMTLLGSCKKEVENEAINPASKIEPSALEGPGLKIVHKFYDGTDGTHDFGCDIPKENCFEEFVVEEAANQELANIIPQLEGNGSNTSKAQIVEENYSLLANFANTATLEAVMALDYTLTVNTNGNLTYFIFKNTSNQEIVEVNPVKL